MTRDEIIKHQAERNAFHATKLGAAFSRFDLALSRAWHFDGFEQFPAQTKADKVWNAEQEAREALLKILIPLSKGVR